MSGNVSFEKLLLLHGLRNSFKNHRQYWPRGAPRHAETAVVDLRKDGREDERTAEASYRGDLKHVKTLLSNRELTPPALIKEIL